MITKEVWVGEMNSWPRLLMTCIGWASLALYLAPSITSAQTVTSEPAAIVEDISPTQSDVEAFDYLEAGHTVHLMADETLILGYLASCLRETIRGGVVTIGVRQSTVEGGSVIREEVECDGGFTDLSKDEAGQSGVVAFRQGPRSGRGSRSNPIRVFSLSPAFDLPDRVFELVVRRLDQWERERRLMVRGRWLDLHETVERFAAGGLYEAQAGSKTVVFKIVPHATGDGPVVGRLVRF